MKLTTPVRIRPPTNKELYAISLLARRYFPYSKMTLEEIRKRMKRKRQFNFLVAKHKGHTVGYIDFQLYDSSGKIGGVAVDSDYQGYGIGDKLLKASLKAMKKARKKQAKLLVSEDNSKAIGLYLREGFKKVGKLSKQLAGMNVLLYAKDL
ncbi:MAG TPA: N-acetyltransferase [Candidatus Norongarragalinales archaeon]|jgi:ribosomal protein S18 acetylase RimI-like enzyme|nr:N-acetyltransferase [Candidatus Norongarragalinales archaeon]